MTKTTWGAVFNRYKARGADPASAAYSADQWEKRQRPDRWRDELLECKADYHRNPSSVIDKCNAVLAEARSLLAPKEDTDA